MIDFISIKCAFPSLDFEYKLLYSRRYLQLSNALTALCNWERERISFLFSYQHQNVSKALTVSLSIFYCLLHNPLYLIWPEEEYIVSLNSLIHEQCFYPYKLLCNKTKMLVTLDIKTFKFSFLSIVIVNFFKYFYFILIVKGKKICCLNVNLLNFLSDIYFYI